VSPSIPFLFGGAREEVPVEYANFSDTKTLEIKNRYLYLKQKTKKNKNR